MKPFEEALVRYFGKERLKKIQTVRVGVAGLGGLGSNCAAALVRSGFRRLTLCDFDIVEVSNLNRQFYFLDQLGQPKPEALSVNLARINPDLDLRLVQKRITSENALSVFQDCDVVVEAFDKPEAKKMLTQIFLGEKKIYVCASGLAGWGDADAIATRNLKENMFFIGDQRSETSVERPPCAPRVMVAAAKQADVILNWVLNEH